MCFPKTVRTALEMSERKRKKESETGGGMKKKPKGCVDVEKQSQEMID